MNVEHAIALNPGQLVSWQDEDWVISEVDGFERVLASRLKDGRREFIAIGELKPASSDSIPANERLEQRLVQSGVRPGSRYYLGPSEAEKARDGLCRELAHIATLPRSDRRSALESLATEHDVSRATAYRWLNLVKQGVGPDGLRLHRSDKGKIGARRGERVVEIIEQQLRKYHFIPTGRTVADCMELINGALDAEGLEPVGRWLVFRVRSKTTYRERLLARGQVRKARDLFRTSAAHLPDNNYPLGIVQIDHSPIQVCFVDSKSRQEIGNAYLTVVVDSYSRMVLGFYISLEAPSALSTGLALARAILPKEEYLKSLGIEAEWPCWGFPDIVLMDNAQELNGQMMQTARRRFRFDIRNRPVNYPQFGGIVESIFKSFMNEFRSIPGTKFSNPHERGEYNSEKNAVFTLDAFEWYFTKYIVERYHLQSHSGEGMELRAPLQRWRAGTLGGDEFPPIGLPDRPADEKNFLLSMMPIERRVIAKGTIGIHDLKYYSHELAEMSNRLDLTAPTDDRKFEIRYDPRDISQIWVRDPVSGQFVDAHVTSDIGHISLWEHRARKQALGKPAEEFKKQRHAAIVELEQKKVEETELTKSAARTRERRKRAQAAALAKQPSAPKKQVAPERAKKTPQELAAMKEAMRQKLKKTP